MKMLKAKLKSRVGRKVSWAKVQSRCVWPTVTMQTGSKQSIPKSQLPSVIPAQEVQRRLLFPSSPPQVLWTSPSPFRLSRPSAPSPSAVEQPALRLASEARTRLWRAHIPGIVPCVLFIGLVVHLVTCGICLQRIVPFDGIDIPWVVVWDLFSTMWRRLARKHRRRHDTELFLSSPLPSPLATRRVHAHVAAVVKDDEQSMNEAGAPSVTQNFLVSSNVLRPGPGGGGFITLR